MTLQGLVSDSGLKFTEGLGPGGFSHDVSLRVPGKFGLSVVTVGVRL